MKNKEEIIRQLSFENIIWILFIGTSILNIISDELIKKSIICNDDSDEVAKVLSFIVIFITLITYVYFIIRNYNDYKNNMTDTYKIRLFGSILLLIGTLCLLYFLIKSGEVTESLSNV